MILKYDRGVLMTEEEIRKYLAILKDRSYEMRIRKTKDNLKNQITQAMLKKSDDDMYELVRELEVCDFDFNKPDNPQPDNRLNQTGEVWFFRKMKWNEPFYIKTKVVERLKKIIIFSCHIDNIESRPDYQFYADNVLFLYY